MDKKARRGRRWSGVVRVWGLVVGNFFTDFQLPTYSDSDTLQTLMILIFANSQPQK